MKLHAQLENTLKIRINSNDEIIPALKKLSELGKLDKPKEIAMFAIIMDRLGKLEDEATIKDSLKNDAIESIGGLSRTTHDDPNIPEETTTDLSLEDVAGDEFKGTHLEVTRMQAETTPDVNVNSMETKTDSNVNTAGPVEDTGTISNFSPDEIVDKPAEEPTNPT